MIVGFVEIEQEELVVASLLADFVDSFNTEQLENVLKFFETMPKLRHVIDVVNPNTKVKGEVLLEGLPSFLG